MSDSSSHSGESGGGFFSTATRLLVCGALYKAAGATAGFLAGAVGGTVIGAAASPVILGMGAVGAYFFIHKFLEPSHGGGADQRQPGELNHDLQRAIARAAALTYAHIIREWDRLPLLHRRSEITPSFLLTFGSECEAAGRTLTAQPGEKLSDPAKRAVREWCDKLDARALHAFSTIRDDEAVTQDLAEKAATAILFTGAGPRFLEYFCERFSTQFEAFFWNEIKTDHRAEIAFFAGLQKYSIALQERNLALSKELKALLQSLLKLSALPPNQRAGIVAQLLCSALPDWDPQVAAYEAASTRDYDKLRISALGGISKAEGAFTLSGLYVDPAVMTAEFRYRFGPNTGECREIVGTWNPLDRSTRPSDSILAAICSPEYPRHIILGGAGTGKSSVLRYLYLQWALRWNAKVAGASRPRASHSDADLVPHDVVGNDGGGTPPLPVPILVEVREFLGARDRAVKGEDHLPVENLIDFLSQECGRGWCFDRASLLAGLDDGRAWLLVDGLDEAFDPEVRKRIGDWLRAFSLQHPKARIIASSRVIGFIEHEWPRRGVNDGKPTWEMHTLAPFDERRIHTFLDHWFRAEVPGTQVRANMREEVAKAIASRPFLKPLAEVPLTLTMVCAVGQRGIQPDNRHAVFYEATKIFIQQWDNARGLPKDSARIVERWREYRETGRMTFFRAVAMKMVERGNPNDSNRISRDDLRSVLLKKFESAGEADPNWLADGILNLICERNFLLTELGGGSYAFFHRAFLEYFTALGWADRFQNSGYEDPAGEKPAYRVFFEKVVLRRWATATWHDTFKFLFGVLPTVPAQRILTELWKLKASDVQTSIETGNIIPTEVPSEAKVLAAELCAEVQTYTDDDGHSITPCVIAKDWYRSMIEWACLPWVSNDAYSSLMQLRLDLRRRALAALATIFACDSKVGMLLAEKIHLLGDHTIWGIDLGRALGSGWKNDERIRNYLCSIVLESRGAVPVSEPASMVPWRALEALGAGWAQDAVVERLIFNILTDRDEAGHLSGYSADMRWHAVEAFENGWSGDANVKNALMSLVDDKAADGTFAETSPDVRGKAVHGVWVNSPRDASSKAWFERLTVGCQKTGELPDQDYQVRRAAIGALGAGWQQDRDVRIVLEAVESDEKEHAWVRATARDFLRGSTA